MAIFWRFLLCALGTALAVITAMFYEDEERKIQTTLEELWLSVSYASQKALAREPGFLDASAAMLRRLLEFVFGPKLLSMRFVAASIMISAVMFLVTFQIIFINPDRDSYTVLLAIVLGAAVIYFAIRVLNRSYASRYLIFVLSLPAAVLFMYVRRDAAGNIPGTLWEWQVGIVLLVYCTLLSGVSDVVTIAASRTFARVIRRTNHWLGKILVIGAFTSIVLLSVFAPGMSLFLYFAQQDPDTWLNAGAAMMVFTIVLDIGNLTIFAVLTGLSLCVVAAHLALPVTQRLLYRLQSIHVFGHRKAVFSLGISLFTLGFTGKVDFNSFWGAIKKTLVG